MHNKNSTPILPLNIEAVTLLSTSLELTCLHCYFI